MAWIPESKTLTDANAWYSELETCISESSGRISNRWATLATVRGPAHDQMAGRPANRTINVRQASMNGMKFVSDTRSGKARDVREGASNQAELCWFFPERGTQFRISGLLKIDSDMSSSEREKYWAELDVTQREWFAYPAPGSKREVTHKANDEVVRMETPPVHFCICTLVPDFVEVFNQGPSPMRRVQYTMDHDGNWVSILVHA